MFLAFIIARHKMYNENIYYRKAQNGILGKLRRQGPNGILGNLCRQGHYGILGKL
jgi:hypothetical protein